MTSKLSILAAAVLAATLPAAAHADIVVKRVRVYYGDLSLDRHTDAQAMLKRIDGAAHRACHQLMTGPIELQSRATGKQCRAKAVDEAVAELGAPLVTYAHANRLAQVTEIASR